MGSYSDEEEDQFFETREDISYVSDIVSDCAEESNSSDRAGSVNGSVDSLLYKIWGESPETVNERRLRFRRWLGVSLDQNSLTKGDEEDSGSDEIQMGIDRITQDSLAVLRTSSCGDEVVLKPSDDAEKYVANRGIQSFDGQMEFIAEERGWDRMRKFSEGEFFSPSMSFEERETTGLSFPLDKQCLRREGGNQRPLIDSKMKMKRSWLRKLGFLAHLVNRHGKDALKISYHDLFSKTRMERLRVHTYSKRSKELSSLHAGQEFVAHEGSILTMKFSLDGWYLASAGEDCIVRVWKVIEDEETDSFDIGNNDPSCLCFTMNHLSQLAPLGMDKEDLDQKTGASRSTDSTCVIFPPKVFRILEQSVHEFHGHSGEILDLSWSKNGLLLSSSIDKTVRLWRVGCQRCLRVFSHNNYDALTSPKSLTKTLLLSRDKDYLTPAVIHVVTSVAFNPMDDNYFISGSIDGKVRIWEVLRCRVVDYTDIRDIVTAVNYRPDGKGGIVGSMIGNCSFYSIVDNQLRLEAEICLQGKKKLPGKRITGFQFSASDPGKVIITSADSLVRVLSGVDVVCKFKASGFRIASSQTFATFTQDGKHIISASEDSNVYIWNYTNQDKHSSRTKEITSCESFLSHNASVAIPWCGIEPMLGTLPSPLSGSAQRNFSRNEQKIQNHRVEQEQKMPHSSPDCFSLTRVLLESLMKSPVTWPEEILPDASTSAVRHETRKSKLKILKNACQSMLSSHLWGLAIVTAGWDGKIRTYCNYGLPIRL